MFFFFPHTYCPMACIKWVLPRPTPPYTKRGLYVRAGACATARLAACAISLFGPTTNDSNVLRGLRPRALLLADLVSRPESVCLETLIASLISTGDSEEMNLISRGSPKAVRIAACSAAR